MGHGGLEFKKTGYETLLSEFERVFPTCPICGSGLGYDATHRFVTYYVRCNSCGAIWQPEIQVGPVWSSKYELVRLLLVEPDKDMQANSLVGKGDRWHKGYKVEFWKALDLGGLKKGEGPTTTPPPPLTDLSCAACGSKLSEGDRFCPSCGKEATSVTPHVPPSPKQSDIVRHQKKVKTITKWVTGGALAGAAILLLISLSQFFGGDGTPGGSHPSDGGTKSPPSAPVILEYVDRDGQQRSAYSHPGYITIIAGKDTAPEAIRALVKSMGATVDVEIANSGLYFTKGFDNRESASVSSLLQNPIVANAFPTPVWSAKGLLVIDDGKTVLASNGESLHQNADGTFSYRKDATGALTHQKGVRLLSGTSEENSIDVAYLQGYEDGKPVYRMAVDGGLAWADERAREDRERGKVTVLNNSWGASLKEVPQGASAAERREALASFSNDERNSYSMLLEFLAGNPNAIAVKAAGNEALDISGILADAKAEAGDKWSRLVIVGALDSSLNPASYSNRAVGLTDILWVPEVTTKDGKPVPGTSFVAPQISYLLNRIAQERPDLTPKQIVSVLFDERVSPRVNLRPTIMDPLSDDTFNKARVVATERFGERKTPVTPKKTLGPRGGPEEQASQRAKTPVTPKKTLGPGGLTPARDLTGTWRNPLSGQGLVISSAGLVQYHDVKWKVKQSGNTISGPMTITWVKGYLPLIYYDDTYWPFVIPPNRERYFMPAPFSQRSVTMPMTGTVEGTKVTINWPIIYGGFGGRVPRTRLTGSFTTDFMTLTVDFPYIPPKYYPNDPGGYPEWPEVPEGHAKLSLSRVR